MLCQELPLDCRLGLSSPARRRNEGGTALRTSGRPDAQPPSRAAHSTALVRTDIATSSRPFDSTAWIDQLRANRSLVTRRRHRWPRSVVLLAADDCFSVSAEAPDADVAAALSPSADAVHRLDSEKNRRRPTLPGPCKPSTIGAEGLNCSVRNGKRCFPLAIATGNW